MSKKEIGSQLEEIRNKYDLQNDEDRMLYIGEACEFLARETTGIERDLFTAQVAGIAGTSIDAVRLEVHRTAKRKGWDIKQNLSDISKTVATSTGEGEHHMDNDKLGFRMMELWLVRQSLEKCLTDLMKEAAHD